MKRLHILGFTCVCLGIAAMLLFPANTHHALAASTDSCGSWNVVASPNGTNSANASQGLGSIAAIAPNDIWAVGSFTPNFYTTPDQTLIEHWNGSQWSIVPSPNIPSLYNDLNSVSAVSNTDVWAVGQAYNFSNVGESLIEHWDGTAWSIISSPNAEPEQSNLNAVAAVSANDIWAVGNSSNSGQALTEHWDGSQWSIIPNPAGGVTLRGVTAIATNNVWAVGWQVSGQYGATLTEHWDGTAWSIVPSPNPSSHRAIVLNAVAAVSASDIWAVGNYNSTSSGIELIEHWNGTKWSIAPSAPKLQSVFLAGVAAVSSTDIWVVGTSSRARPLTEHWNGTTWKVVPGPNLDTSTGFGTGGFGAIVGIPGSNYVWAVGSAQIYTGNNIMQITLTAYYC